MIKLFGSRLSGHSYKVRLALELADIAHDYIPIDLSQPRAERPATFRRHSRFDQVPVLVINNQDLCQSNLILQYLAERHPLLAGADPRQTQEWLYWESNRIGMSVPNLRVSRLLRPAGAEVEAWLEQRARADLAVLDGELRNQEFLVGSRLSIADLSASAYLWWLTDAGLDIREWPNVEAWLQRISATPRWRHPDALMAPPLPA